MDVRILVEESKIVCITWQRFLKLISRFFFSLVNSYHTVENISYVSPKILISTYQLIDEKVKILVIQFFSWTYTTFWSSFLVYFFSLLHALSYVFALNLIYWFTVLYFGIITKFRVNYIKNIVVKRQILSQ